MLTYTFEERGDMPYYEYLYIKIRNDILNGTLSAGEKLPSRRAFAAQLSVSVMTIENAYAQLIVEGYIYAVERKGYFVSDTSFLERSVIGTMGEGMFAGKMGVGGATTGGTSAGETGVGGAPAGEMIVESFSGKECGKLREAIGKDSTDEGESVSFHGQKKTDIFADFTSNTIQPENFPFSVWAKLMRRVLTESRKELLLKPPAQGMPELRGAIADHLQRFRGMRIEPEQVVIGAGTEYLYSLLIQLLGRDKVYGVENPGYRKISRIYHSNGVSYRTVKLDGNGIDVGALRESGADVIHISPSHHFPTGIVTPISRRGELLAWACEREERYIIEDDYDCEFRFTGRPIPTMAGIDRHDRVIYMNTFSKSLSPSIRISYMVLPGSLAERFRSELGFYSCTVSNFEQMTLAAFLSEGYFEKHINRLRNYYREKRNLLIEAFESTFPGGKARVAREDAGLHFLLHLKTNLSDTELKTRALMEGIRVTCLTDYYESEGGEGYPRRGQTDADGRTTQQEEKSRKKKLADAGESMDQENSVKGTLVINYSGIANEDIIEISEKMHRIIE